MRQIVNLDPSIAVVVNIGPIGQKEIVPVYFTSEANWEGNYTLKVFNSDVKNDEKTIPGIPVGVAATVLTFTIDATAWAVDADTYYYEITHTESKRIIFKGSLNIVK